MSYSNDPRWITARFDGRDIDDRPVKRGERVLYYPLGKRVLTGEKAEAAWREFEAARADEAFMNY